MYHLYIANKGSLPAQLESINFGSVAITCANSTAGSSIVEGVAGAGTTSTGNTSTISNADCAKMFEVSIEIGNDGNEYKTTQFNKVYKNEIEKAVKAREGSDKTWDFQE